MQKQFIAEMNSILNCDWSLRSTVGLELRSYYITLQPTRVLKSREGQMQAQSSELPICFWAAKVTATNFAGYFVTSSVIASMNVK